MYPFFRMAKELIKYRNAPDLGLLDTHVSHHICWPWDLDFWLELNNGRTLMIYDLGRIPMARRVGMFEPLRKNRWGLTVAGSSVRYRRRVRMFQKVEMHSKCIGWDDRFIYLVQSMWRAGECTSQALYRTAVTDKNGIVAPARLLQSLNQHQDPPELPEWVRNWITAEDSRPWPPAR
ncbi:hypothetical protein ATO10_06661 [Actibacterium atlanticum]|uniref:Thioeseterase n=1 Tax=Actibacterium atlanticum TaxID=1461693 RepID=A0A058ZM12_9RHOB|nr:acyl-CoA thioesterase [Actibacterium atlanticum]KCV82603.1 hypothetical protein ATO10_06661 [Actibacterium atlanticum]